MRLLTVLPVFASVAACSAVPDFRSATPDAAPAPVTPAVAPVTPEPTVQRTAKERLVSAIEANGCSLTTENVAAVLELATISQDELLTLAPELEAEGRAEVSGSGSIRVLTETCV